MKAVIQTVLDAECTVDGALISRMKEGLLVYFGVDGKDTADAVRPFIEKILRLRIYRSRESGKMSESIMERTRSVMLISQFTLLGNLEKGNRPSFDRAMNGEEAEKFYEAAVSVLENAGISVSRGVFGAHMMIRYTNDGPETFILEK